MPKEQFKDIILNYLGLVSSDEIFLVWYCKTLQNHKALLGVTGRYDEYFEAAYDGDKNKVYLDVYKKDKNIVVEPIRIG